MPHAVHALYIQDTLAIIIEIRIKSALLVMTLQLIRD